MSKGRTDLQFALVHRYGELMANLGRYDMHAVTLANLLGGDVAMSPAAIPSTISTRGQIIRQLMSVRGVAARLMAQFTEMESELQVVIERQAIAAEYGAYIPGLGDADRDLPTPPRVGRRAWFDYLNASEAEMVDFMNAIEKDIVKVTALYLRLSSFALHVKSSMVRIH
jgi:hypothetical protein